MRQTIAKSGRRCGIDASAMLDGAAARRRPFRPLTIVLIIGGLVALVGPSAAWAREAALSAWSFWYGNPNSATLANAFRSTIGACAICHAPIAPSPVCTSASCPYFNAYGKDVRKAFKTYPQYPNLTDAQRRMAIQSIEAIDSDEDGQGKSNLEEIRQSAQPGWNRLGTNKIYSTAPGASTEVPVQVAVPAPPEVYPFDVANLANIFTISPVAVDYRNVTVGSSARRSVDVRNNTGGSLKVIPLVASPGFILDSDSCGVSSDPACPGGTLGPGQHFVFSIDFRPTAVAEYSASLKLVFDRGYGVVQFVELSGDGTALAAEPSSVQFAAVTGQTSAAESVTIRNAGSSSHVIGVPSVSDPRFTLSGDTCAGATLAANGTCTIELRFTPSSSGWATGSVSVPSNAGGTIDIGLFGYGLDPSMTTITSSGNPSTLGQSVTFTATVSPTSAAGRVDFRDGTEPIAGCQQVDLFGGVATCTTSALSVGVHGITARYSGSGVHGPSVSAMLSQSVLSPGTVCTYIVAPSDLPNVAKTAHVQVVTVTTPAGCLVSATSFQPWVVVGQITPSGAVTTVQLHVSANAGPPRATTLVMAGRLFLITQAAGP